MNQGHDLVTVDWPEGMAPIREAEPPRSLTKRRAKGAGSIYKRGSDGRWCGVISTPYGRRTIYAGSRAAALKKLQELKAEMTGLGPFGLRMPTVARFLDYWLRSIELQVRPATLAGYSGVVRNHLKPTLGAIPLDRVRPLHVQDVLDSRTRAGLSPHTVHSIHVILKQSLEMAVVWGVLSTNPAARIRGPRLSSSFRANPLSPEEARRFLAWVRGHRREALYALSLTLGLRQGEVLGLTWADIDFQQGVVRVHRQIQRIGGRRQFVELKTQRAHRTLAVPPFLLRCLLQHRENQIAEAAGREPGWNSDGLLFTTGTGNPLDTSCLIQEFHNLLLAAGLKRRRFHDLRHSASTLMLMQGVPPRVAMEILGHSQVQTTMNIYSHVLQPMHRDAAAKLEEILGPVPSGGLIALPGHAPRHGALA